MWEILSKRRLSFFGRQCEQFALGFWSELTPSFELCFVTNKAWQHLCEEINKVLYLLLLMGKHTEMWMKSRSLDL